MRIADYVITAAAVVGLSGTAMAQTPSGTPSQTPATQQPASVGISTPTRNPYDTNWMVSGYVGTTFSPGTTSQARILPDSFDTGGASFNVGGQLAYLWSGKVGAEFLADFSPSFNLDNVLFENSPQVNDYMFNAIAAIPIGGEHLFQPYVSGGIGAITLRSRVFALDPLLAVPTAISDVDTVKVNGSRFGWDIGAGGMGFSGNWGFRGDIRYYRATVNNTINLNNTPETIFANQALSGLNVWKANVGLAFRW